MTCTSYLPKLSSSGFPLRSSLKHLKGSIDGRSQYGPACKDSFDAFGVEAIDNCGPYSMTEYKRDEAGIKLFASDRFSDLFNMGPPNPDTIHRLENHEIEANLISYPGRDRIRTYIPNMGEGIERSHAFIRQAYEGPVWYCEAVSHGDTMPSDIPAIFLHGGQRHPMRAIIVVMVFPNKVCERAAAGDNKNRPPGMLKNRDDFC